MKKLIWSVLACVLFVAALSFSAFAAEEQEAVTPVKTCSHFDLAAAREEGKQYARAFAEHAFGEVVRCIGEKLPEEIKAVSEDSSTEVLKEAKRRLDEAFARENVSEEGIEIPHGIIVREDEAAEAGNKACAELADKARAALAARAQIAAEFVDDVFEGICRKAPCEKADRVQLVGFGTFEPAIRVANEYVVGRIERPGDERLIPEIRTDLLRFDVRKGEIIQAGGINGAAFADRVIKGRITTITDDAPEWAIRKEFVRREAQFEAGRLQMDPAAILTVLRNDAIPAGREKFVVTHQFSTIRDAEVVRLSEHVIAHQNNGEIRVTDFAGGQQQRVAIARAFVAEFADDALEALVNRKEIAAIRADRVHAEIARMVADDLTGRVEIVRARMVAEIPAVRAEIARAVEERAAAEADYVKIRELELARIAAFAAEIQALRAENARDVEEIRALRAGIANGLENIPLVRGELDHPVAIPDANVALAYAVREGSRLMILDGTIPALDANRTGVIAGGAVVLEEAYFRTGNLASDRLMRDARITMINHERAC